jgi:hypothetical protein
VSGEMRGALDHSECTGGYRDMHRSKFRIAHNIWLAPSWVYEHISGEMIGGDM